MRTTRLVLASLCLASLSKAPAQLFQALDNSLPSGIEAGGDFDGDGDHDLVVPGALLLNDGHGRFLRTLVPSLAFFRSRTKAADLNGDGLADLIATSAVPGLQVHLNQGGLVFTTTQTLPLGFSTIPDDFALGDVDGDGDVDLLAGTLFAGGGAFSQAPPVLFLNDGTGTLTAAPAAVPGSPLPGTRVLLVDLDGDGDRDAIFAGLPFGFFHAINSGGIFTLSPYLIWPGFFLNFEIGRFNADALPDIVFSVGAGAVVLMSSPSGFLPPVASPGIPGSFAFFAPIDLNGDGIDELLESRGATLSVIPLTSSGAFGTPTQSWTDLVLSSPQTFDGAVHDLDGDGDRDAIAFRALEGVTLMNAGNGSLIRVGGRIGDIPLGYGQNVADVDADGDLDSVGYRGLGPTVSTGLNDGTGFFAAGPTSLAASNPTGSLYTLHAFDRDGDGDADLYEALWFPGTGTAPTDFIYDNVGGSFTLVATPPSTGDARGFLSADFDGDGDQDLVMGRWNTTPVPPGAMVLRTNLGAAGFAPPFPIGLPRANNDLDLGDFDGNGTIDVFQTNAVPAGVMAPIDPSVVYLNSGTGTFTAVVLPAMSGLFTAAGNLNGDAMTDLVIDGQVWFAAGAGTFVQGPPLQSGLIGPPTLVDVDLDGDLDLVETPGTVMFNVGSAVFGQPQSFLPRLWGSVNDQQFQESVVADVDRDGDPDIIAPGLLLLMNTTRQLAHASVPRPGRPASLDLYGTPGGAWFLFGSSGTANFLFPPWGTVMIDPASAQLGATGFFAGTPGAPPGTASFGVVVPNNPALIGSTSYWQAIDATQMRFTNRLTITVMGY